LRVWCRIRNPSTSRSFTRRMMMITMSLSSCS
jgi:hypothetical protein